MADKLLELSQPLDSNPKNVRLKEISGDPDSAHAIAVDGTGFTQPVSATNFDIRDLTATDVVTANLSATDNAVLDSLVTELQLKADLTEEQPVFDNPLEFHISRVGSMFGKTAKNVYILGRRTVFANTTPFQDVAQYLVGGQNAINTPAVGTTYYLNSTSANDVNGNTGADTVRIVYLDSSGDQQVTTKTLNGTTAVSIGAGYTFIQWMEVAAVGSSGAAVGDLTISSINGAATEATTMEMIKALGNRSLSGRYKVPTGYSAYISGWFGSAAGSQAMDLRLRATVFADDRALSTVFHFQATMYLATTANLFKSIPYYKCPASCVIKTSVFPAATTGTPRCDSNVRLFLVQD
jgi:hypothetical protein